MPSGTQVMSEMRNNYRKIRWLTYFMFLMFAMTTDAVGVIIPELIKNFDLSLTEAGLIHYVPMISIALSGLFLGFLADKLGRKFAIILGLTLFAMVSLLFSLATTFIFILFLMAATGIAIGIFKTAALALVGDISTNQNEHTGTMNGVEAFFGVGAIIGPFCVTYLINNNFNWTWLYLIAGALCIFLILLSLSASYPSIKTSFTPKEKVSMRESLALLKNPYALVFSIGAFLYVASESAIYVWMPTYLKVPELSHLEFVSYALSIFFVLRALGRFMGMWLMRNFDWAWVMLLCSGAIFMCFLGAIVFGRGVAVFTLPLSGLFMSVIYPTLNSKGISCFRSDQHGAVAGVILFFTAMGAALGPLMMGLISDAFGGDAIYGFMVASVFSALLFLGFVINLISRKVDEHLKRQHM
jgi:FHS family L-fucose permease-like MFS transporter